MAIGRFNLSLTGVQPGGLVYVGGTTFSAASTVSVDNVFSADYDNYMVYYKLSFSNGLPYLYLKYRTNGTDNSSSTYAYTTGRIFTNLATDGLTFSSSFHGLSNGAPASPYNAIGQLTIASPALSEYTTHTGHQGNSETSGAGVGWWFGGSFRNTTIFDGFTMYPGSGNFTGTIRVYGYRNDNN